MFIESKVGLDKLVAQLQQQADLFMHKSLLMQLRHPHKGLDISSDGADAVAGTLILVGHKFGLSVTNVG